MSAREKKTLGKKLTPSPVPTQEIVSSVVDNEEKNTSSSVNETDNTKKTTVLTKKIGKKDEVIETPTSTNVAGETKSPINLAKTSMKKQKKGLVLTKKSPIKSKLKREFKARGRPGRKKINISKNIKSEVGHSTNKKGLLLRNGALKPKKLLKRVKKLKSTTSNSNENLEEKESDSIKKKPKKTLKKVLTIQNEVSDKIPDDIVIADIDREDIEASEDESISSKTDTPKKAKKTIKRVYVRKTPTKKQKQSELKKENIVKNIAKDTAIDSDAQNVINMLDLNVSKVTSTKINKVGRKRRHSIEKIAIYRDESEERPSPLPDFSSIPRSASPKSKRVSKIRQSVDIIISRKRTRSPYSTRSDSPARILRNGKHRKLKDMQLLDGIGPGFKKRRRMLSDSRESEISKYSGYLSESESSYCESTVSGLDNGTSDIQMDVEPLKEIATGSDTGLTKSDLLRKDIIDCMKTQHSTTTSEAISIETNVNLSIKTVSSKITNLIKRNLPVDLESSENVLNDPTKENKLVDTENNNTDKKLLSDELRRRKSSESESRLEISKHEVSIGPTPSPSTKVPEKLIILDQMAQNFNDVPQDGDPDWGKRTTRASWRKTIKTSDVDKKPDEACSVKKFYGENCSENVENNIIETEKTAVEINLSNNKEDNGDILIDVNVDSNSELAEINSEIEGNKNDCKLEIQEGEIKDINGKPEDINNETVTDGADTDNKDSIKMQTECKHEEGDILLFSNEQKCLTLMSAEKESQSINALVAKAIENLSESIDFPNSAVSNGPAKTESNKDVNVSLEKDDTSLIKISVTDQPINETVLKSLDLNAVSVTIRPRSRQSESISVDIKPNSPIVNTEVAMCDEANKNQEVLNTEVALSVETPAIIETPENLRIKESILNALGLQSLKAAAEAKAKTKRIINNRTDPYTGTLKTVIKLNRPTEKKKGRGHLKMTFQKRKNVAGKEGDSNGDGYDAAGSSPDADNAYYKVMKEVGATWHTSGQSSESADGSSEQMSDDGISGDQTGTAEDGANAPGKGKTLVIPEKASSFSIHPHRLCRDECCYCFGKFGLFDTPCHIAQIKSTERQRKILETEKHLTAESCLCDACYRHVDRKANTPSYNKTQYKRTSVSGPEPRSCHALGCQNESTHTVRKKWILKMKRNLQNHIQIDLDTSPSLHSIPVCENHFGALERLMACSLCKRRLARNHAHPVGAAEAALLNEALEKQGLPVRLTTASESNTSLTSESDKSQVTVGGGIVCKLCRYFATLLLKPPSDSRQTTMSFFKSYKKRLLHFHDVEVMDEAEAEEPIPVPTKEKSSSEKDNKQQIKKTKKTKPKNGKTEIAVSGETIKNSESRRSSNDSGNNLVEADQPPTTSVKDARVPSTNSNSDIIELDVPQPSSASRSPSTDNSTGTNDNKGTSSSSVNRNKTEVPHKSVLLRRLPKDSKYIVELRKVSKDKKQGTNIVERLETNPSISVRQLFPGEDDLPLQGSVEFGVVKERTPEGWEKCTSTIQYDHDTKRLWQELQKPYGNQSSFLRHLILLEKYFRNGDLALTPSASHYGRNYCESVQNRLRAYDSIPSHGGPVQPLAMLPFNNPAGPRKQMISQSGIVTGSASKTINIPVSGHKPLNTVSVSQVGPNFVAPTNIVRQRSPSMPPGLISLQASGGTRSPIGSIIRMPASLKKATIATSTPNSTPNKITKQWRPTLIPITQSKVTATITSGALGKTTEIKRMPSLVQVMSGGKPYHISVQDYNRMCLMKRENELRKKKLIDQSGQKPSTSNVSTNSISTMSVLKQRSPGNTAAITTQQNSTPADTNGSKTALEQLQAKPSLELQSINKTTEPSTSGGTMTSTTDQKKTLMILPKIPKSLTVIPQTVRRPSEAASPNLSVTSVNKTS